MVTRCLSWIIFVNIIRDRCITHANDDKLNIEETENDNLASILSIFRLPADFVIFSPLLEDVHQSKQTSCRIKPSKLMISESFAVPDNSIWSYCQYCSYSLGKIALYSAANDSSAQSMKNILFTSSLWQEFFHSQQHDQYHLQSIIPIPHLLSLERANSSYFYLIPSNYHLYLLPMITFHPGHLLIDLYENLYYIMINHYGGENNEIDRDHNLLILDVANEQERQDLQKILDRCCNNHLDHHHHDSNQVDDDDNHNLQALSSLLRFFTSLPVFSRVNWDHFTATILQPQLDKQQIVVNTGIIIEELHLGMNMKKSTYYQGYYYHPYDTPTMMTTAEVDADGAIAETGQLSSQQSKEKKRRKRRRIRISQQSESYQVYARAMNRYIISTLHKQKQQQHQQLLYTKQQRHEQPAEQQQQPQPVIVIIQRLDNRRILNLPTLLTLLSTSYPHLPYTVIEGDLSQLSLAEQYTRYFQDDTVHDEEHGNDYGSVSNSVPRILIAVAGTALHNNLFMHSYHHNQQQQQQHQDHNRQRMKRKKVLIAIMQANYDDDGKGSSSSRYSSGDWCDYHWLYTNQVHLLNNEHSQIFTYVLCSGNSNSNSSSISNSSSLAWIRQSHRQGDRDSKLDDITVDLDEFQLVMQAVNKELLIDRDDYQQLEEEKDRPVEEDQVATITAEHNKGDNADNDLDKGQQDKEINLDEEGKEEVVDENEEDDDNSASSSSSHIQVMINSYKIIFPAVNLEEEGDRNKQQLISIHLYGRIMATTAINDDKQQSQQQHSQQSQQTLSMLFSTFPHLAVCLLIYQPSPLPSSSTTSSSSPSSSSSSLVEYLLETPWCRTIDSMDYYSKIMIHLPITFSHASQQQQQQQHQDDSSDSDSDDGDDEVVVVVIMHTWLQMSTYGGKIQNSDTFTPISIHCPPSPSSTDQKQQKQQQQDQDQEPSIVVTEDTTTTSPAAAKEEFIPTNDSSASFRIFYDNDDDYNDKKLATATSSSSSIVITSPTRQWQDYHHYSIDYYRDDKVEGESASTRNRFTYHYQLPSTAPAKIKIPQLEEFFMKQIAPYLSSHCLLTLKQQQLKKKEKENKSMLQQDHQFHRICASIIFFIYRDLLTLAATSTGAATVSPSSLSSLPARQVTPSPYHPFIFYHVEKTAGTTLRELIYNSSLAIQRQQLLGEDQDDNEQSTAVANAINISIFIPCHGNISCLTFTLPSSADSSTLLSNNNIISVLAGHFHWGMHQLLPQCQQTSCQPSCLIMNRHPIQRITSFYYERIYPESSSTYYHRPINSLTNEEWRSLLISFRSARYIENDDEGEGGEEESQRRPYMIVDEGMENAFCRMLLPHGKITTGYRPFSSATSSNSIHLPEAIIPLTKENVSAAIINLQQCVIGIQEQWLETIEVINFWFPWINFHDNYGKMQHMGYYSTLPHQPGEQTQSEQQTVNKEKEILSAEKIAILEEVNSCDIALYQASLELFQNQRLLLAKHERFGRQQQE